jgi:hypothetical protein
VQATYLLFELFASIFIVVEQVEGCAGGRKEHGVSGPGVPVCSLHRVVHGTGFDNARDAAAEGFTEATVVNTEADERMYAVFDSIAELGVIVAFVGTSSDPYYGGVEAFEGVPCGVDVGSFRVVNVAYAVDGQDVFKTMFYAGECG